MRLILAGVQARLDREQNTLAWQAWLGAALSRTKKLPSLKSLMKKTRRQQTWQEQLQIMNQWAAQRQQAAKMLEKMNGLG